MAVSKARLVSLAGAVQFAVGDEPIWIGRGGAVGPLLHARIDDTAALPEPQHAELLAWLVGLGLDPECAWPRLVITRGGGFDPVGGEYTVHLIILRRDGDVEHGTVFRVPVDLKTTPSWLRSAD